MFCPSCKALMRPVDGRLACPKCATTKKAGESMIVKEAAHDRETVIVDVEKDKVATLPTATEFCEKCGHNQAYYYFRQTRAADEATTRFLECTKCAYKWRDYR